MRDGDDEPAPGAHPALVVMLGFKAVKSLESGEHSAARPPCAVVGYGSGALRFKGALTIAASS